MNYLAGLDVSLEWTSGCVVDVDGGIAQLVRANLVRPVHVKTVPSQEKRMLFANRRFMLKQLCDAEAHIRGTLRNFGLKMGKVTRRGLALRCWRNTSGCTG